MNQPKVGVGVLIFDEKKLLLGKRIKDHGAFTWGPPGGHLEFGETFEECAIRETQEETGLTISNPTFATLTNDIFTSENKHYVSLFLSAVFPKGQSIQNLEPEKTSQWEWFAIDSLPENLFLPLKNLLQIKGKEFLQSQQLTFY